MSKSNEYEQLTDRKGIIVYTITKFVRIDITSKQHQARNR